ncbi:MAG: hypothetical protein LBF97_07885, partial [Elusimicrobiota bacterium]|nr:hypothetical protein [Elusimicrobiota bacterium]
KKEYFETIELGLKKGLIVSESKIKNLYKFFFYFFFECIMPETLIEFKDKGMMPIKFKFKSEEELNNNEELDYLFNCIEKNIKPNFSKFYNLDTY